MKKNIGFVLFMLLFCVNYIWSQDTLILQPGPEGKDALFHTIWPNNNYENTEMFKGMAWTHSGVPGQHRSVIEFDVSMIAPGAIVLQARLSLYFGMFETSYVPHTGSNSSYLVRITEPWEENEVAWNNQPATTMEDAVILPQSTDPEQDYPDIDVTDLVQLMIAEPENNYGLMLRLITEQYYRSLMFSSGDCEDPDKRPRLEIIYIGCMLPTVSFEYDIDGQIVDFTGISPTAQSWHWDFGDGDTSNLQNPQHYYEQQGFYQVCLHVEDTCYFANHCEEIEICFAPPVAGFTYTAEDLIVDFQDTSLAAGEFYWDFGDGYFSSLKNPSHIYDTDGSYTVCLIAWNSCGSDTICQHIDLCLPPVSLFEFEIDDLSVYFQNTSLRADAFFWDFGDGYYSNLENPWHIYETLEDYEVCLTTWNECGNDESCDEVYLASVAVPENEDSDFAIYPNPARDQVFIKTNQSVTGTFILYDLSGKELVRKDVALNEGQTSRIDLDDILPGIYIIRLDTGQTQIQQKLVVLN